MDVSTIVNDITGAIESIGLVALAWLGVLVLIYAVKRWIRGGL